LARYALQAITNADGLGIGPRLFDWGAVWLRSRIQGTVSAVYVIIKCHPRRRALPVIFSVVSLFSDVAEPDPSHVTDVGTEEALHIGHDGAGLAPPAGFRHGGKT